MVKIGDRYGRLKVISYSHTDKYGYRCYLCKCNCGNEKVIASNNLSSGKTKSCGCLVKEKQFESHKKYNEYYVYGDIVFVKFSNCDEYFICDLDDWERLKTYCWRKTRDGYAYCSKKDNKYTSFHRSVIECPNDMQIDHIFQVSNGVCDNRKSNLRIVTLQENLKNKNPLLKPKHVGVSYRKDANKWRARIMLNGKDIHIGYFDTFEDALNARQSFKDKNI